MSETLTLSKQELAEFLRAEIDAAMKPATEKAIDRETLQKELQVFGDAWAGKALPVAGSHRFKSQALNDPKTHSHIKNFLVGQITPTNLQTAKIQAGHAEAVKAMSIGTGADGGYLVPDSFREEVGFLAAQYNTFQGVCQVVPMESSTTNWPIATDGPATYWPGENTAITDGKPTIAQVALTANIHGALVYLPRQLAFSTKIDVIALLAELFAEKFAYGREAAFTGGNGTSKPTGFRDAGYTDIPTDAIASTALAWTDLKALMYLVAAKFRARGTFVLNSTAESLIMGMVDGNDRPLWMPSIGDDKPATILGKPYVINDSIPSNLGAGTNKTQIWFGYWKHGYIVGEQQAMIVESTTEGGDTFAKHQLAVKGVEFVDGCVGVQTAIASLTGVL